ncbi:MAG: GatB/YqeY domain-containing protein [Methylomonas sp.]|nr:GatB/YqeY domain-containing protein [Methylomonas sp.]PPD21442.1 MAG: glutamyl-tRNA amidotransferase [Methylomonas sp.]PPD26039.1 MAG: glutamyl-tRNA amidotransferase [Methylomonas sp.]PPD37759.1 MAG: glutamyl-tRNA amidotransferase [Methylomonas sp.]PPD41433.1 MAG: glutamyl-tRNA amidotransferase [Methylomonas sp.]
MDSLNTRIRDDMKASMKAGNKDRLGVIRMIMAAVKQVEVDERIEVDDARTLVILDKMLKQRRESIKQFRDAGRIDLAEVEEAEIVVIQDFLPQALTEDEIDRMVAAAIAQTGATSVKDMGAVMAALKPQMQGRADMAVVSARIKAGFSAE